MLAWRSSNSPSEVRPVHQRGVPVDGRGARGNRSWARGPWPRQGLSDRERRPAGGRESSRLGPFHPGQTRRNGCLGAGQRGVLLHVRRTNLVHQATGSTGLHGRARGRKKNVVERGRGIGQCPRRRVVQQKVNKAEPDSEQDASKTKKTKTPRDDGDEQGGKRLGTKLVTPKTGASPRRAASKPTGVVKYVLRRGTGPFRRCTRPLPVERKISDFQGSQRKQFRPCSFPAFTADLPFRAVG